MSSSQTTGEVRSDDSHFCDFPGRKAGSGRPSAILRSGGGLRDREALSEAANSGKVASAPWPIRRIPVYTATASQAGTVTFNWTYTDPNNLGAPDYGQFENAGYVAGLNQNAEVQLAGGGLPLDSSNQASGTGTSFSVNAGDTYGIYISSIFGGADGVLPADILVSDFTFSPTVNSPGPTPGAGLLSLAALLLAGAAIKARGASSRPR